MAEVAKLMVLLHEEKTPKDLFKRPNSDLIRAGLEKFYSILAGGIGEIGDGKLGLETWNHLQIQAVVSVAKSIVSATRSLSVENAEPIMIAIFEKSLEFSTRCLEKLMAGNGDFSLQGFSFQIFRGLAYIHTVPGVCHRDVKPQNLLQALYYQVKGEANILYICFRYYRAPELIFGATEYTTSINIWSAGCVLAELLLGPPLFLGESAVDQLVEIIKVLGTPTRDEIRCMNPNYTEFFHR